VTSEIAVICRYFIILFFGLFNVNLKTNNYVSKIECLSFVIPRYISASSKWKLRNDTDVDYFAGDNVIIE